MASVAIHGLGAAPWEAPGALRGVWGYMGSGVTHGPAPALFPVDP